MPPEKSLAGASRFLATCVVMMLATACASGPYTTKLKLVGSDTLNPTRSDNTYTSVTVRIFPLIETTGFKGASDEVLLSDNPDFARSTWIEPFTPAVVYVGEENNVSIEIKPKVRFLGIIGEFNKKRGDYRTIIDVNDIVSKQVDLDNYQLQINPRKGN